MPLNPFKNLQTFAFNFNTKKQKITHLLYKIDFKLFPRIISEFPKKLNIKKTNSHILKNLCSKNSISLGFYFGGFGYL